MRHGAIVCRGAEQDAWCLWAQNDVAPRTQQHNHTADHGINIRHTCNQACSDSIGK